MNEDELNELVERVHQVAQFADTIGWALLKDRAVVDMAKIQQAILSGTLDHDSYLRKTGEYAGMSRVLGLPEQMRRELDTARALFVEERELEEEEEEEVSA